MANPIKITVDKCIGCKSCAAACSLAKTGKIRPNASGVVVYINQFKKEEKPVLCRQCKQPKCVEACPNDSLTLNPHGVVLVNETKCTGCWDCVKACPFKAMHKDTVRNLAVKCDLCSGQEAGPRCVRICPVQSLSYPKE